MPIQDSGENLRLRGNSGDGVTDINEEINGNATDTDVSLGTLNTVRFATVAEGDTVTGRSMSEMEGYSAFTSAFPSTEANGALGESLLFDRASNPYVNKVESIGSATTCTVSMWFKPNGNSNFQGLFEGGTTAATAAYYDGVYLSGNNLAVLSDRNNSNSGGVNMTISNLMLDSSSWYHLVVAYDTTKSYEKDRVKIYVNGIEIINGKHTFSYNSGTGTYEKYYSQNTSLLFNQRITVGSRYSSSTGQHFDGVIADVKFIDGQQLRPDSFGELVQGIWIPKAFNKASTDTLVTDNLNVNLQLVGNANDEEGNYDGTATNVDFLNNNYGIADFNGSSSKLKLSAGALASGTSAKSITMWIATTTTAYSSLVRTGNGAANEYWLFRVNSGTKLGISGYLGSGDHDVDVSHTGLFNGLWHQVAVTYDGTTQELFVDGQSVGTKTMSSLNIPSQKVFIGYQSNDAETSISAYFDGKIGEVQFYNDQLTRKEVLQNYNATKHKYTYGLNGFWLPLNNTSTGSIDSSSNLQIHLDASDSSSYVGSGTTWSDLTSNGRNATLVNGLNYISSNGGYFDADGSNDYINLNYKIPCSVNFTLEYWFKYDSTTSGGRLLGTVSRDDSCLALECSPINGAVAIQCTGAGNSIGSFGNVGPTDTNWHHWVITRNGSKVIYYLDGVLKATSTGFSSTATYTSAYDSILMSLRNGYAHMNGSIAQFRYYDDTLTAQEIITNYRATQGNYEQVSTVDISGNANNFTATNIDYTDHIKDEPLDNYATFDPNNKINGNATITLSEGNTKVSISSGSEMIKASIGVNSGKWYWEMTGTNLRNGTIGGRFGIVTAAKGGQTNVEDSDFHLFWHPQGNIYRIVNGSYLTPHIDSSVQYYDNDVLAIALDAGAQEIKWYKNNTLAYTYDYSSHVDSSVYLTAEAHNSSSGTPVYNFNFGQNAFTYDPPTGFKALSTSNLAAPEFDPDSATPDKPSNYFKAVTYQGNGDRQGEDYGYKEGSKAAVFNGSSSKIDLPSNIVNSIKSSGSFSISAWFNTSTTGSRQMIFSSFDGTYIMLEVTTGNQLKGTVSNTAGTNTELTVSTTVTDGNWHHALFTGTNGDLKLYLDNGSPQTSTSWNGTFFNGSGGTDIGSRNGNNYFNGKLDELRIYDKKLNSTEVGYLADDDTTNINAISNLVAHYDMEGDSDDGTGYTGDTVVTLSSNAYGYAYANSSVNTGKYYWEIDFFESYYSSTGVLMVGAVNTNSKTTSWHSGANYFYYAGNGNKYSNNSNSAYSSAYNAPVTIGVKLDMTNGTIGFTRNGTDLGTAYTGLTGYYHPAVGTGIQADKCKFVFDSNDWAYSAPSGYSEWTAQITSSIIAGGGATAIQETYNGTDTNVTYTQDKPYGNIDLGFTPDFVWIKDRDDTENHVIYDSIRGAMYQFNSNNSNASTLKTNGLTSFDSNGFSLGSHNTVNTSGDDYVAWAWKAAGAAVTNTDGTNITSTVSANTDAGFSIIKYTGDGNSSSTFGHGLNQTPDLYIHKDINNDGSDDLWGVYHVPTNKKLFLSETYAGADGTSGGNNGILGTNKATSTTLGFAAGSTSVNNVNDSGTDYIVYAFHSVDGFSKIDSYTGNGSNDGPFIYTGFKPAWILLKRSDSTDSGRNWTIVDNAVSSSNTINDYLLANTSDAEANNSNLGINFYSNGFAIKNSSSPYNVNDGIYIYMAFAEDPVKYSNGVATLGDGNEFVQDANYPEDNFTTNIWTGNNANSRIIKTEFSPDLVWVKSRSLQASHGLFDSVRGANRWISSERIDAEQISRNNGWVDAFLSNGFTLQKGPSTHPTYTAWYEINQSSQTYVGWSWKAAGHEYKSAKFNGSSSNIATNITNSIIPVNSDFSISGWINISSTGGFIFGEGSFNAWSTAGFGLQVLSNNKLELSLGNNGSSGGQQTTTSALSLNTWYHVVVTIDIGNALKIYINGNEDGTTSLNTNFRNNVSGGFYIGSEGTPDHEFNGKIDQVRIFNKALSTDNNGINEIETLYNETKSTVNTLQALGDSSCIATYRLNGDASDLSDNYNGTESNIDYVTGSHFVYNIYENKVRTFSHKASDLSLNTGTITPSDINVNRDNGFSIVKYTGNGTAGATVGHGLSVPPEMVIVKGLDNALNWIVYNKDVGSTKYIQLNTTGDAELQSNYNMFNSTAPSSTVFSLGNIANTNSDTLDYIAYCWHSVPGFSKIGKYTGNGSTSGPTIATGFEPAFILIKRTDADGYGWYMMDNKRGMDGSSGKFLFADDNDDDGTLGAGGLQTSSTGFQITDSGPGFNANNGTYIYMAFAHR